MRDQDVESTLDWWPVILTAAVILCLLVGSCQCRVEVHHSSKPAGDTREGRDATDR